MFFTKHRNRSKSLRAQRVRSPHFGVESLEPRRLFSSLVVTTLDDSTSHSGVSLRDAIAGADFDAEFGTSDTITFDPSLSGGTITLAQGVLELNSGGSGTGVITIDGANQITVSGNAASTVFQVDSGVTASISGLTITDGAGSSNGEGDSGGINNDGTLTVANSTLSDNTAAVYGGGILNANTLTVANSTFSDGSADDGGGICNLGTLTVVNSTLSGDSASEDGGGIDNGYGVLTVTNSTLSENSAAGSGGGICTHGGVLTVTNSTLSGNSAADSGGGISDAGQITVTNSTLSGNSAADGGGIYNDVGTLTLLDTIVAGNTASSEADGPDIYGALPGNSTYNLIGDGTAMTGITNGNGGNQVGTGTAPLAPGLLPLDYNGGPTQTMALTANSPARKAGGRLTTLTAAVGAASSPTNISVGLGSAIASTPGSYVIQIDSEQMLVTNASGNTLSVTRGYNGTPVTSHSLGARVFFATDQTGAPRVGAPDIGAFQFQTVTSSVNPLPFEENTASFPVSWSGTPGTDGYPIAFYSVYVSDDNAQFTLFEHMTTDTAGTFTGVSGQTYRFYSVATDTNGQVQATPAPQAYTSVLIPTPPISSANHATFTVGAAASFAVVAGGTPAPTYSETGTLPSGITLNSTTGSLSGTPASGMVGAYDLTFSAYNGFGSPATQAFTLTIASASSKTTLTKSTTSAIKYGQSVTFTAAVAPASTNSLAPTGAVTFYDNGGSIGTATLTGGIATLTTTSVSVGSNSIVAIYAGDTNFTHSTSGALSQTVTQSATTTALTKSTTTTAKFGQSITFTATMAAVSPGAGTPTGTVTFEDGSTVIGTGSLSGGVATFTTASLAVGSHSIKAIYGGDTNFSTSTSGSMTQTVAQSSTTTKLTKNTSGPITSGTSVTFTATVAAVSPGAGLPANGETVTFMDNGSSIGTETLSGGVATLITTTLPVGSNSITAIYSGDTDYTTSTSNALSQTVNA